MEAIKRKITNIRTAPQSSEMLEVPICNDRRSKSSSPKTSNTGPGPDVPEDSNASKIKVHPYTEEPAIAWDRLKDKRSVKPVRPMALNTPIRDDAVRFVCVSCMYGQFRKQEIPRGDILLVAGSFTSCGLTDEMRVFDTWAAALDFDHVIVIAGSHDLSLDSYLRKVEATEDNMDAGIRHAINQSLAMLNLHSSKSLLQNVIYLMDSAVDLYGITIYGTPWLPREDINMAFMLNRGQHLLDKWNLIPTNVDVLMTHAPPLGHGDFNNLGHHDGDVELLNTVVKRIKPKYHVFGHSHYGYGCTSNGITKFLNCVLCDDKNRLAFDPIIFDFPLAGGSEEKLKFKKEYNRRKNID